MSTVPKVSRRGWIVTGVVAGWGLVVLGLALWAVQTGPETVRSHSELAAGRQALDRAVDTLRAEAGPDAAATVEPYQVSTGCRLTLARDGTEVARVVVLSVPAGAEAETLERLAQRVPAEWQAQFFPTTGRLRADAGDFVTVVGELPDQPGQVRLTVATGCRPGTDPTLPDQ